MRLLLLLFFTSTLIGQGKNEVPETFSIDKNGIVIWQKIYEYNLDHPKLVKKLEDYFLNTEFTRGLSMENSKFVGYSNELKVKPIKGGPHYNPITAFVEVEVKDKRYRVTIKDIKLKEMTTGVNTGMFSVSQAVSFNFSEIVLNGRKTDFKKGFVKINYLKSHDEAFDTIFTLKQVPQTTSDW
ncbi:hypothetical protein [Maribacter arcticus]|uniref:hypothetical protein n=1 Tax=Maribacter arcticus TaxID=561365 RepID=UPI0030034923